MDPDTRELLETVLIEVRAFRREFAQALPVIERALNDAEARRRLEVSRQRTLASARRAASRRFPENRHART